MRSRPTALLCQAIGITLLLLSISAPTSAAPVPQTPTPAKPVLLTDPVPDPKQDDVMWFPATGHTLRGAFLSYWQQYGGLAQFGYPLTEEFFEPVGPDNKPVQVQYFERAVFEHHPENAPPNDVLLSLLGSLRYRTKYGKYFGEGIPSETPNTSPGSVLFTETGKRVGGAFLQYWQQQGGLSQFGYPISDEFQEKSDLDGKVYTVQYFERAVFELHPENTGSPYEVLLGLLGRQLSEKKGYPYGWYPPYGHATDWSWVSGEWIWAYRSCFQCQCHVVRYVEGGCYFCIDVNVKPVGRGWDPSGRNMGPPIPPGPIVIYGNLLDTNPQVYGEPCFAPAYNVTSVQNNPAKQ